MTNVVPAPIPETMPLLAPIAAMDGVTDAQEPPAAVSVRAVVRPIHTALLPLIFCGSGFTDITEVVKQPVGNV